MLRRNRLCQLLKDYKPSIFGIQEGLVHQVAFIDSSLSEYNYIGVGRDDGKLKAEFCAIFYDTTSFENKKNSTYWLSETPDVVSVGWDAALERICTYGLLEDRNTSQQFWVFNTHFDLMGIKAREESSLLILEMIKKINRQSFPIILMGDFNSLPDSAPIQKIKTDLRDALEISLDELKGPIGTYNGFNVDTPIVKRIDYIFMTNFKVHSYIHINKRLDNNRHISDHLPVMVIFQ